MARPHAKLRGAMIAADIDESYLARKLLRGTTYISQRMVGKKPWAMDEVYTIMDLLQIPYDQMAVYFPPRGA
jgi:hypothetical protein